jgi:fermentation-respiration switch protein FrsA (DUF1100 family)
MGLAFGLGVHFTAGRAELAAGARALGLGLLAWLLPPPGEGPVLLFLHGNGGHIGHRTERIRRFAAQGWGALLVEYRGYGGTPGTPSEAGLRLDAAAGLAALRGRGIPDGRIVLWGDSLGSGLATWLAARERLGAVVLETPYTSIAAVAKRRYPFAPVEALLRDRFDSLVHMPAIRSPVLVLVGARDVVVPPDMGHAIHAAAPDARVRLRRQRRAPCRVVRAAVRRVRHRQHDSVGAARRGGELAVPGVLC